jgi:hypothetical protein
MMRIDPIVFKVVFEGGRTHERAELKLPGRVRIADMSEYAGRTIDIAAGGLAMECDGEAEVGDHVVASIEGLGAVEGEVVRKLAKGFAFKIHAPQRKIEKLSARIAWLVQKEVLGLPERRAKERELTD